MSSKSIVSVALLAASVTSLSAYAGGDNLRLGGSSTVFPFASVVAERMSEYGYSDIVVESLGTGSGFKLFCKDSSSSLDIANASRRMSVKEFNMCSDARVGDVVELKIGYDGVTIIRMKGAGRPLDLTPKAMFLALANEVPSQRGRMISNPHKYWSDVDPNLPRQKIKIFGPPTTSGTRDSFVELVMRVGAKQVLPQGSNIKAAAADFRRDGVYVSIGESDNLILKKLSLRGNEYAIGILGFSYFDQNKDVLQAQYFEGVMPLFENILSGKYKISRTLYMYIKATSLDDKEVTSAYFQELFSDRAMGSFGYLESKGLVPISQEERQEMDKRIWYRIPLSVQELETN